MEILSKEELCKLNEELENNEMTTILDSWPSWEPEAEDLIKEVNKLSKEKLQVVKAGEFYASDTSCSFCYPSYEEYVEWMTKYEPDDDYIRYKINIQKYKNKETISDYATHYVSVRKEDLK